MHTSSSIFIRAEPDAVFALVSNLRRWPEHLPHYREVEVLQEVGGVLTVRMAAWRGWIPVAWVSRYHADASTRQLHFEHLQAFTKGMVVVWDLVPEAGGTRVTIRHDLQFRVPWLAPLADRIIGGFFIGAIAPRTLATFKQLAEARA